MEIIVEKTENVNIKLKNKCIQDGCDTYANFNILGEKRRLYCTTHKKTNMVNIVNKTCKYEKCNKIPAFNYVNETVGLFCLKHKNLEMVNVISKRCENESCNKYRS